MAENSFKRPTLTELKNRTKADYETRLNVPPLLDRSVLGVMARTQAGASHMMHGHLDYIVDQVTPDTATSDFLARWATVWGVQRIPASFAEGVATFTGITGTTVPAGTRLQRSDGQEFQTSVGGTLVLGTAEIPVIAITPGDAGNTQVGVELSFVSPISDVDSQSTVSTVIAGGADEESDDNLRLRVLERIQEPPHGGADFDYEYWAKLVSDVTRVFVSPLEMGVGTVTVRFTVDNHPTSIIPDGAKVAEVQEILDDNRPVTAEVFVVAPNEVFLDPEIILTPDTPEVREAVEANLNDLLSRESVPGGTLLLSHIKEAISTAEGEEDHTLVSPVADVTGGTGDLYTLGTITWS